MAVTAGERRLVSVLMADVAGSTAIGEALGPERSKFLFDEVVRLMAERVREYGGTVAQLQGDGLLALFGAPVAHEDDAERAVRAGLEIQRALGRLADEVRGAYGVDLSARVGVNTGMAVVAPAGDGEDDATRYNALGDTVNVAARLQQAAATGQVAVGPDTARQVAAAFELECLGDLELKGKERRVESFAIAGERGSAPPPASRPLIGRDYELAVLERTVEDLTDGRGVIVAITGEAGIGKTRLVAEVCRRSEGRVRFLEGRAVSYASGFPFWPVRELLREWLGVGAATPEARVRLELKTALATVLEDDAPAAYPFVANLLGLALEPDARRRLDELNREGVQRETFRVMFEWACRLASREPLMLVFEDLHWADDATLELLEELLAVTEEASLGFLLLYRSERDHRSWRVGERARQRLPHRFRELELRPLSPAASRALAVGAAEADLPAEVGDVLVDRAGGNPFFLEEAVRDLIERGALERQNGRWELAVDAAALAVPTRVQGALQARLDRLDPAARRVLELGAVAGRGFSGALLERLVDHRELIRALSELQRLDLIVEHRRRPVAEYRFRHGLVQEVAYARLLEPVRRSLHREVGEALEDLYADERDELSPVLARHFAEADDADRAIAYSLRAGDRARSLFADEEAIRHYRRARRFLARTGDSAVSRETLFKIALAHHLAFRFDEAESAYDEAFCCREPEPPQLPTSETLEAVMNHPGLVPLRDLYTTEGGAFLDQLYRGLLAVDRDLNLLPSAADNFRVSGDGLTYLFQLREGMRWSDGAPLVAEDFTSAWQRRRDEGSMMAFLLDDVAAARALDDRTIEIELHEPRSAFPYVLAHAVSFPIPRHRDGEDDGTVGNGPFRLVRYDESGARLEANAHWIGPRGNLAAVEFTFLGAKADAERDWRDGRYDVGIFAPSSLDGLDDTVVETLPGISTSYLGFRTDVPPFRNVLLRRAVSLALDPVAIAEAAGISRPALGGLLPPAMPGHTPRMGRGRDVEGARALLAEAGHAGGRGLPPLRLLAPRWLTGGEVIVAQLAEVGLDVEPIEHSKPPLSLCDSLRDHDAQIWVSGWTADFPDPDGFLRGMLETDLLLLDVDDDVRAELARARSLTDQQERLRLYHRLDRVLVLERAVVVPLGYGRTTVVRRAHVSGLAVNPLALMQLERVVR